jgi:wyosine [tRNA(Phe)-imidazoG37] synthetase (radical SAM superfamily)
MLVNGINDHDTAIQNLSDFLNELRPLQSYLSIPNRPPAEPWVKPPDTKSLNHVFSLMSRRFPFVYSLFEPEDSTFISTGDIRKDILGINAVHPMRENALLEMINKADADWAIVDELLDSNQLGVTPYLGEVFYFRCFK